MSTVGAVMDVAGLCCRSRMRQRTLLHNAVPYGLRPNTFQRRDHLALSSLRCALGQALSASFGSLSSERSKARAQDDTPASAAFNSQHVFFEMHWALCLVFSRLDLRIRGGLHHGRAVPQMRFF